MSGASTGFSRYGYSNELSSGSLGFQFDRVSLGLVLRYAISVDVVGCNARRYRWHQVELKEVDRKPA